MKINCTSIEFKTDITQLCNECPLVDKINKGLKEQILFQALEQKDILNNKQFEAYVNNEIEVHQKAKQRVFLTEKQNKDYKKDPHRAKRIEIYIWNKESIKALNRLLLPSKKIEISQNNISFEDLFYNSNDATVCLSILRKLDPPFIDADNNYVGKSKGIFPLWISVLKAHSPNPLIKHLQNIEYKNILNRKVKGLNLSKDASEFRKFYKRLENNNVSIDIKTILSQLSQEGRLGK